MHYTAFRNLRAQRAFQYRSYKAVPQAAGPDWLLILVVACSLMALGFLFVDEAAAQWKASLPKETLDLFRSITRLGKSENYLVPSGIIALGLAFAPWDRLTLSAKAALFQVQMMALFIFVAVAGAGLSNNVIKIIIGRARPRYFEEFGAHYFNSPGWTSGFQSFPSGHSTTAGAMAIALTLLFPRLKWLWIAIGLWIAFSRVVVGAHYPSDIVAGFLYGATFAWMLAKYSTNRRLLFRVRGGFITLPKTGGLSLSRVMKALHMLIQKA